MPYYGRYRSTLKLISNLLQAKLAIAKLTTRLPAHHDDPRRKMAHAYGRVGGVYALTARTMRPKHLHFT